MDCAVSKKKICEDRSYILSIINTRNIELIQTEKNIQSFLKKVKKHSQKYNQIEYINILILTEIHAGFPQFTQMLQKNLPEAIETLKKYFNNFTAKNDNEVDQAISYYLGIMAENVKMKCNQLLRLCVGTSEETLMVFEQVELDNKSINIRQIIDYCENFGILDNFLKKFVIKLKTFFSKILSYKFESETLPHGLKICLKKTKNQLNYTENLLEIFRFLDTKLFELLDSKVYFYSKLDLLSIISLCPDCHTPEVQGFLKSFREKGRISERLENNLIVDSAGELDTGKVLGLVREYCLSDEFRVIEVSENTEKHRISSIIEETPSLQKSETFYSLPKTKIPHTTSSIISLVYDVLKTIDKNNQEDVIKKISMMRSCIQYFLNTKSNTLSKQNALANSICLFYNSCKYIIYHLICINAIYINQYPWPIQSLISFSDLIFLLKNYSCESLNKILTQLRENIQKKLNIMTLTPENITENITEALKLSGNNFALLKEILNTEISCGFIGKLIDFIIITLNTLIKRIKVDNANFRCAIAKIFDFEVFFNGVNPCKYSKQWAEFKKLYQISKTQFFR